MRFVGFCVMFLILLSFIPFNGYCVQPSFYRDVAKDVLNQEEKPDEFGRVERMYQRQVDRNISIKENIIRLFYPSFGGGQIRGILRIVAYGLVVGIFVRYGIKFLIDADGGDDAGLGTIKNMIYAGGGVALFLGSIWLVDTGLGLTGIGGSAAFVNKVENVTVKNVFAFFKAFAFFFAIIMLIRNGYQIMQAVNKEEKLNQGKNAVINVIIALIFIKGIDYVYFIAQLPNFKQKMTEGIINVAKVLGFILGAIFFLGMFYAGVKLVIDGGKGEGWGNFKKTAYAVFFGATIIFLFLLVSYQIIQEFA